MSFEILPSRVYSEVFKYLDIKDMSRICRVSKRYNDVVKNKCNVIWERFFETLFPESFTYFQLTNDKTLDYRKICYQKAVTIPQNIQQSNYRVLQFSNM